MTATATVLLSYTAWTLLMLASLGALRTIKVVNRERAPNAFQASGEDVEGFAKRLTRVHANCYENLPIAGVILLYAIATDQTMLTDGLAYIFLGARLGQSVVHLISTSNMFVRLRFALFLVQIIILVIWLLKLFHHI